MKLTCAFFTCAALLACSAQAFGESADLKTFASDYTVLAQDLLNNPCQMATVTNFTYKKDAATFVFDDGVMHLLRYVKGRPTTAIFVGTGSAHIEIPTHPERHGLVMATRKEAVHDTFQVIFIRMSDDFDLELKKQFSFQETNLDWKYFNAAKTAQGEVFFLPRIDHTYDNYFELLRSAYERDADGYFWADFNRYTYTFDPNRPEEVIVGYEVEGGDVSAREVAVFQRSESGAFDDSSLSNIPFPTTIVDRTANLTMGGNDGRNVDYAAATCKVVINVDSAKFISLFLHHNLREDSIYCNGKPVDYWRRKDFDFIGLILPAYAKLGDTLTVTMWYKGKNFDFPFPYVENPAPAPLTISYKVPHGYNYFAPGMGPVSQDGRYDVFTAQPQGLFSKYVHEVCASGFDTIPQTTASGLAVNILKSEGIDKKVPCYIPDEIYRPATLGAFDFFNSFLGAPSGQFSFSVYPQSYASAPGLVGVPQIGCVSEGSLSAAGGFSTIAGPAVARQWFGPQMRPKSDREIWIADAMPLYLGAMYIQQNAEKGEFYSHLASRRDTFFTIANLSRDLPLACGSRGEPMCRMNKAVWVVHMLRFLMLDPETMSDKTFLKFVRELYLLTNLKSFDNSDIIMLAEKHYGQSLDWFFDQWLYGRNYPNYDITYTPKRTDAGWVIECSAKIENVDADFSMPVLIRVTGADGASKMVRQSITGNAAEFAIGPFAFEPTEFNFNEFFSVLSNYSASRK